MNQRTRPKTTPADALLQIGISPNVPDSNSEPANLVDAIGNDAHMVLFLHKPPDGIVDYEWERITDKDGKERNVKKTLERPWPAELIVGKNRNGELGVVTLAWDAPRTTFECWDKAENQPNYEPAFEQEKF